MLTDEELKELEEAVALANSDDSDKSVIGGAICAEFTRDAIAREKGMSQPLTAEICERLGPNVKYDNYANAGKYFEWSNASNGLDVRIHYNCVVFIDGVQIVNPTVGHLFAAATLAGVELDWRKVEE